MSKKISLQQLLWVDGIAALLAGIVVLLFSSTLAVFFKLNAGITTTQLNTTKEFYQRVLRFGISFENDFYVVLHTPNKQAEISFLQADHPSQQPIFQSLYPGKGMYLTIEVPDVDAEYKRIKELGVKIEVEIRDEPWGDRHFAFYDPNGIGIDIVTYHAQ